MLDKLDLLTSEYVLVDTTNNSAVLLCVSGKVVVKKEDTVIAVLNAYESFTLPIQTNIYSVIAEEDSIIYLFRVFVF